MSLDEQIVDKLDNTDVVAIALVGLFPLTLFILLATEAPFVVVGLATLGFLAWAGVRSGVLAEEEEDPLEKLNRRYAEDEITQAEWERKRDQIVASRDAEADPSVEASDLLTEDE